MKPLLKVLRLWRPSWGWLLAGLMLSLASLGAGVALLTLAGTQIAHGLAEAPRVAVAAPSNPAHTLLIVVSLALLLRVFGVSRVVLRYLERLVTHAATFRALAALRVWFFRSFAAGSAGGLGFRRSGDAVGRLVDDIEALDGLYLRIIVPLAGAIVLLPALLVLVGRADSSVAIIVTALFGIAAFALPAVAARISWAGGGEVTRAGAGLRIAALDAMSGLREVRAFGAESRMQQSIRICQDRLLAAQAYLLKRGAWANAGVFLCAQLAILAVLATSGRHPWASITVLFLTVASFDAVLLLPRAGALAGHSAEAAERVMEAAAPRLSPVTTATARPLATASTGGPVGSTLRFDAVHFRWQDERPPVFDGLTLEVPAGARVAVLGPSGSGKSTLAALALKVAVPQAGRVLFGGVDVATVPDAELRARIGWLSQATHLFSDTIRGNLLLARPDASDADLWRVLEAAKIADVVKNLPDGLDSWVGEAGSGFSGGQGRRLVLARALLSSAPLLILDEPCTGLDAETERAFFATLNEAGEGRSVMLIVHRLIGVERLDRIWRLSGGRAMAAMA
jgi:ATP-binding cassette subfamily C protein CydC